jgi:hypothetical protein
MASSGSEANFGRCLCAASRVYAVTQITLRPAAFGQPHQAANERSRPYPLGFSRSHAFDRVRPMRPVRARLIERYVEAKLPALQHLLANCPKSRSQSIYDRCKLSTAKTADSHDCEMGPGYRRARSSALAGGGAFGSGVGSGAASNFPSAARSGSRRGAWGNRSSSMARRIAFDGAPDCRCHRGKLVGGEVNCRHGPDIVGRHLPSKKRLDGFDMSKARRRDDRSPQPE